jgi:hypothetical protein
VCTLRRNERRFASGGRVSSRSCASKCVRSPLTFWRTGSQSNVPERYGQRWMSFSDCIAAHSRPHVRRRLLQSASHCGGGQHFRRRRRRRRKLARKGGPGPAATYPRYGEIQAAVTATAICGEICVGQRRRSSQSQPSCAEGIQAGMRPRPAQSVPTRLRETAATKQAITGQDCKARSSKEPSGGGSGPPAAFNPTRRILA